MQLEQQLREVTSRISHRIRVDSPPKIAQATGLHVKTVRRVAKDEFVRLDTLLTLAVYFDDLSSTPRPQTSPAAAQRESPQSQQPI